MKEKNIHYLNKAVLSGSHQFVERGILASNLTNYYIWKQYNISLFFIIIRSGFFLHSKTNSENHK